MCLEPDSLSSALACPLDLGARPTCRGLRDRRRALSEGREAPQAAFPSCCLAAQTQRCTGVIRFSVAAASHTGVSP